MIGPADFAAEPIRSPAGHASTYAATEHRLEPVLGLVPITRVYDATALDWLGLPVWAAVTPLALDLTVHAGKGRTPAAARISAVMEAIERVCAEEVAAEAVRVATYEELDREGGVALDPETFDLPFETTYRADGPISWVEGYDLIAGTGTWVALDLVLSPPREGVCTGVETNGLAAGNTVTEATLHALYELIERDAQALDHFGRRYAEDDRVPPIRVVAEDSIPDETREWMAALRAAGLAVVITDLTHDLGVPVLHAMITDAGFPGHEGRPLRFAGMGCDLDPAWAVSRAACEAVQSHTAMVVGARDTFEVTGPLPAEDTSGLLRRLLTPTATAPLAAADPSLPGELRGRLSTLVDRLVRAGLESCVVVDLTRRGIGVPVVRVLVPGLSGPYGCTTRRPGMRLLRVLLR